MSRYYRPAWSLILWQIGGAVALALALWFAGRASLDRIRQTERRRVLAEAAVLERQLLASATRLQHERDSLAHVVAQVDTVLVTRLRTIRDTAWLPADTTPRVRLAACRAQLDTLVTDCTTYRRVASTALAKADTIMRRDSAVIAGLTVRLTATRRADSATIAALSERPRWRTLVGAVIGTAALTSLLRD